MYNLKIGVIESIDDVLANGTKKLDDIGLTEIQLSCWNVPLCNKETQTKLKKCLEANIAFLVYGEDGL